MFCTRCGRAAGLYDRFCQSCGQPLNPSANQRFIDYSAFDPRVNFRSQFALTFIFALGTAFFWLMEGFFPVYTQVTLLGIVASMLSWAARITVLSSYLKRSANLLAASAICSTSSGVIYLISSFLFGAYNLSWPFSFAWIFSLSTLVTYFIQARKAGLKPYVIQRRG